MKKIGMLSPIVAAIGLLLPLTAAHAVDTIPPSVSITSPTDNALLSAFPTVSGTASDTGGSGLSTVQVDISYFHAAPPGLPGGRRWWTGSGWATRSFALTATVTGGTWTLPSPYPSEQKSYDIDAVATDVAGNVSATSSVSIKVDLYAPGISITTPDSGITYEGLSANGTFADFGGVDTVYVYLYRTAGNPSGYEHWNGVTRQWVEGTQYYSYNASGLTSGTWTVPDSWLPHGAELPNGTYKIKIRALDLVGHITAPLDAPTYTFYISDVTAPNTTITTPANGATLSWLTSATGTASDSGSRLDKVYVYLYRTASNPTGTEHWNSTTQTWLEGTYYYTYNANTATSVNWSVPSSWFPTGTKLPNGTYKVRARAVDFAGNIIAAGSAPTNTITISH